MSRSVDVCQKKWFTSDAVLGKYCLFYNKSYPLQVFKNHDCKENITNNLEWVHECEESSKWRCEETEYKLQTSFSEFPTREAKAWFFTNFLDNNPRRDELLAWQYFIENVKEPNKTVDEYKNTEATLLHTESVIPKKTADWISYSFARVNIYFNSMTILRKSQQPSYTMDQLWADIGGTMGLWAGLSVLAIVEFLTKVHNFLSCAGITKIRPEKLPD